MPSDKTTALALPTLEPKKASSDFLFTVLFPKSNSKIFPVALKIAHRASQIEEGVIDGRIFYLVSVSKNIDDIRVGKLLLQYVSKWTGSRVYVSDTEHRSSFQVMLVLECIIKALSCNDPKAHCYVVKDHPVVAQMKSSFGFGAISFDGINPEYAKLQQAPKLLIPCRYIADHTGLIQHGHPSSIPDQIQAAAVRHGCHWCPMFDAKKVEIIENH